MNVIVNEVSFAVIADENNEFLVSTKDVAQVFAVDESTIRTHKMGGELRVDHHFIEGVGNSNSSTNQTRTMWTKKGIVRLGFLLRRTLYTVAFRDWAEDFIISGGDVKQLTDEETVAKAMNILTVRIEAQKMQLEQQAPKVHFAESVSAKADSIQVGVYCKVLEDVYDVKLGENKLRAFFRYKKWLTSGRDPSERNKPARKYIHKGWFEEKYVVTARGQILTTFVTGTGQVELEAIIVEEIEAWLSNYNWKKY